MLKLYKQTEEGLRYHEAWASGKEITEHWGIVGDRGTSRDHKRKKGLDEPDDIVRVLQPAIDDGYGPIEHEDHFTLLIEYPVNGMGTGADVDKRHKLQSIMDQTLGWTGLGACDGGSIGSGTMEVCCFVVDFDVARAVIAKDLLWTEFANYTRIYDENAKA